MKKIMIIACVMIVIAIVGCSKDIDQLIPESPKEKKTEQVLIDKKEQTVSPYQFRFTYQLGFEPE